LSREPREPREPREARGRTRGWFLNFLFPYFLKVHIKSVSRGVLSLQQ